MSVQVNFRGLPPHVLEGVYPRPEQQRTSRSPDNVLSAFTFPKSKVALWDPSPNGDVVSLHLSYYRNPVLLVMEKALRLAHRHARQSNKPTFPCFLLGALAVDSDEEGVTLTLDRFDPGREQPGSSGKAPTALLPGDFLVPCTISTQGVVSSDTMVHSADDFDISFKMLQHGCCSREAMELSKLLTLRAHLGCAELFDSVNFSLNWVAVTIANTLDAVPVRPVPIIPTALARNLSSPASLTLPLHSASRKQGFLTMDQTRKLLLVLESDPKAYTLPLVGVWLSGITHIHSPQVWAWCLRYLFSSSLQDKVMSEGGAFLVLLYSLTHRDPEFYQCQLCSGQQEMGFQLLTATESLSLYKHVEVSEGRSLQFELSAESQNQETEFFMEVASRASVTRTAGPAAASPQSKLSLSGHDSGVEDEELSPRPSPNPHPLSQQTRRVHPSVPELSLVMDGSFLDGRKCSATDPAPSLGATRPPRPCSAGAAVPRTTSRPGIDPTSAAPLPFDDLSLRSPPQDRRHSEDTPAPDSSSSSSSSRGGTPGLPVEPSPESRPPPAPARLQRAAGPHSAPLSGLLPGTGRSPRPLPPGPAPPPSVGLLPADAYRILVDQDRQLKLLQAQIQRLLEAQGREASSPTPSPVCVEQPERGATQRGATQPGATQAPTAPGEQARKSVSVAVCTGASLFWSSPADGSVAEESPSGPEWQKETQTESACVGTSHHDSTGPSSASSDTPRFARCADQSEEEEPRRPSPHTPSFASGVGGQDFQSPVLGESASMCYQTQSPSRDGQYQTQSPSRDGQQAANGEQEQRFYQDLLGQVNSRLQGCVSGDEGEEEEEAAASRRRNSSPRQAEKDQVLQATLRQLKQLGVTVALDPAGPGKATLATLESASTLACINPEAVITRLTLSDSVGASIWGPSGSTDLSLEANAIALKYLSDTHLSQFSQGARPAGPLPAHNALLSRRASTEKSAVGLSILSPSNLSFATRKYMRKYGLMEGGDSSEEGGGGGGGGGGQR
ncbi:hypothetical protein AAFF_G00032120 [Aldrovandia affinis]|uniref:SCL-interrupting locus protein n=1 Tax=Aldrovandia affinis TaxID=143900 RepID=A0AAD7S455_9TELE|nr:hypothetical protein AAFF_G00032120 [Aldrovandia affinis]